MSEQKSRRAIVIVIVIAAFTAGAVLSAFVLRSTKDSKPAVQEKAAEVWYCPMHHTVTSDKPGNCPICGMSLVKREAEVSGTSEGESTDPSIASVSLSPSERVMANVRTVTIEPATHTGELVTTGRVTFDERRLAQVTSYTAGRIEKLYLNFTGDSVRKGEVVATLYSPELFATQQEYLLALRNRERMQRAGFVDTHSASGELVESTRRRLQLFGMGSGQIVQLERTGKSTTTTEIVSPVSGVVTKKGVVPQQYVAQGQALFEIADLSTVWVEADVFEQQLSEIRLAQKVSITSPAFPGEEFPGTVSFIQPVLGGQTRTASVRVELSNPAMRLKPDMYVSVKIFGTPAPAHLMVPKSAVIDRGYKQFVWVERSPGSYEPREIQRGAPHGDQVVVLSGIEAGDVVVVEGGFLLDSESQIRSATTGAAHQGH